MERSEQVHFLNGDGFAASFPERIEGKRFVVREALIDGPLGGEEFEEFFATRAKFVSEAYEAASESDYVRLTKDTFEAIADVNLDHEINLWFGDDLFCQTNLWFIVFYLSQNPARKLFIVRMGTAPGYDCGFLSEADCVSAFAGRTRLDRETIEAFQHLWRAYQIGDVAKMKLAADSISAKFPSVADAVEAHTARDASNEKTSGPIQTLRDIVSEMGAQPFSAIFAEFKKREPIYGFGDLQVRRLLGEIGYVEG